VLFQWFLFNGLNSIDCIRFTSKVELYIYTKDTLHFQEYWFKDLRAGAWLCYIAVRKYVTDTGGDFEFTEHKQKGTDLPERHVCNWSHTGGSGGPSVWKLRTALYSLVTHPQNRFCMNISHTMSYGETGSYFIVHCRRHYKVTCQT
jgi:hypothetical protein